ncbi:MAG TPA: peptide chain release factor-like protein [Kofleriaceae bacterium]|nr:peptide chain release factor-like protein [Kofleriaceae bacterium]
MTDFDLLITSGVGPAEARRFVVQLAARLERLAALRGLAIRDVALHGAPDDAPRSVTLRLHGDPALLAGEHGSHVLVHRSTARGRSSRKRWFAAVSLHPSVDPAPADLPALPRDALEITACRAGGPGGQHVNKVSSAVRVHHLPSGLTVRCAGARSQKANLEHALRRLAHLLHERAAERRAAALGTRREAHYRVERGRAVRTYHLDDDGVLIERSAP